MMLADDPIIRSMEQTGYPPGHKYNEPICPCCGSECETVYKADGEIVGCDVCLISCDAWEEDECMRRWYEE